MTIEPNHWHESCFQFPKWGCPSCSAGLLDLGENEIHTLETTLSRNDRNNENWDPDWIIERFSAFLCCQSCGEVVVILGKCSPTQIDEDDPENEIRGVHMAEEYTIVSIYPSPPIFPIHTKFPTKVSGELKSAFSNFWSDHAACANSIRRTIEAAMVEQGMKTTKDNGKPIFLHSQIEEYQQTNPKVSKLLLGIKWLGNYGSHVADKPLSKSDLLDGLEVLEHALEKIYIRGDEYIENLAAEMTQNKGKP